jgi:hypothetical protein
MRKTRGLGERGGKTSIPVVLVIYLVPIDFDPSANAKCAHEVLFLAHSYVYTFEPNPNWSGFYASSEEIQQYLEGVCNKYSVHRFVKLRHRVDNCVWDETNLRWLEINPLPPKGYTGSCHLFRAYPADLLTAPTSTGEWRSLSSRVARRLSMKLT